MRAWFCGKRPESFPNFGESQNKIILRWVFFRAKTFGQAGAVLKGDGWPEWQRAAHPSRRASALRGSDHLRAVVRTLVSAAAHVGRRGGDRASDDVWKMASFGPDRQAQLWQRLEHDGQLLAHARYTWKGFAGPPIKPEVIAQTEDITRRAVAKIRSRGGEVIFVRPPSAPELRINEDKRLPRSRGWDALLATAQVQGVYADGLAGAAHLPMPDYSHTTKACARLFTDMYVRRMATLTDRLPLLSNLPAPLTPDDCA